MSNKTLVCIYTEGATDKVFYDILIEHIREKSNKKFNVDEIKKYNIAGIGNFKTKLINKFNRETKASKYKNYKKIVVLCYDKDVFELINQTPPVDWKIVERELKVSGANKVIHLVAEKSIEDIFLLDIDNVLKFLKLSKNISKKLSGNGFEKLRFLYKKANKIYVKGTKVEEFVYKLDIDKICKAKCQIYCQLCYLLLGERGCNNNE